MSKVPPQLTPWQPGNTAAARHGAGSLKIVDPVARELVEGLLERRPDLENWPEALLAWGRAEARCCLVQAWQAEHGVLDGEGKPTVSPSMVTSWERLAQRMRERLGLDPRAEADLAAAQADAARNVVDIETLRARGRQALKARRKLESAERLRDESEHLRDAGEGT